jgi:nicotinamide-nucleotide amidase
MVSAEIISIGTELLLGQIVDTNSQFLSSELAALGIDCYFHSTVGDNPERIMQTFKLALDRADIVITTGGLGPTADDLTIECIADLFASPLILDKEALELIQRFFRQRNINMPKSNEKQALRPQGADILPNPMGTAPGVIWQLETELLTRANIINPEKTRYIITFPGVPSEMKVMWKATAHDFLSQKFGDKTVWSCELKHYGIGESALAEKYAHLLHLANPTIAPYAGTGECRLRITAKAQTKTEAQKLAEPIVNEIKNKSGILFYGLDNENLESVVGKMLIEHNMTVSFAESCTGGLASKRLTDISGSSKYTKLNVVTYSNDAKHELLHVDQKILDIEGAVSDECAKAMAQSVRQLSKADIGVSITGIAGPDGGSAEKPVGLVYFALATNDFIYSKKVTFPPSLGRDGIRYRSASEALNMIRVLLLDPKHLA